MEQKEKFGIRLRQSREKLGMSQQELAETMDDGTTQGLLSRYESGDLMPRKKRMSLLSKILKVPEPWLRAAYPDDTEAVEADGVTLAYRTNLHNEIRELQNSELEWQRKDIESQRKLIELERKLHEKELAFSRLTQNLAMSVLSLESLHSSLNKEQKRIFNEYRDKIVTSLQEATFCESDFARLADRIKSLN